MDTCPVSYGRTNCHFSDPKNPMAEIVSIDQVGMRMGKRKQFWAYFEEIMNKILDK